MTVSFKAFVNELCEAVANASENLRSRNTQFFESYFHKTDEPDQEKLIPNTVRVQAPVVNSEGVMSKTDIEIPVLSLIQHSATRMRKVSMKIDLQLHVENEELKVDLVEDKHRHGEVGKGTLEIILSPDESPEGLQSLIESYENMIKNQLQ